MATDASLTTSYTPSGTSSALPIAAASASAPPSSTSPPVENFGAGTQGTAWGKLSATPPTANRGPAFEAVSIILLAMAALTLAFRCAHLVRLQQDTTFTKLHQVLRTYVH